MSDAKESSEDQAAGSKDPAVENETETIDSEVNVKVEFIAAEDAVVNDNVSLDRSRDEVQQSVKDGEEERTGDEMMNNIKWSNNNSAINNTPLLQLPTDAPEGDNELPESASRWAEVKQLRPLIESGSHFLQCAALASQEEYERQLSLYKKLAEKQLKSFNKELVKNCPVVITNGSEGMIFKVEELRTCPLEVCFAEKFATHAGFDEEENKFSFGFKRFGKNVFTREIFNPVIKKCYEAISKYVHKSGKPFHVLRRKPPGFWSALTIVCNKKKELLVQMEVHVSQNQYKRQSCELEKLKFMTFFTDGAGKDCNILSLQWKEYMSPMGYMNTVLFGKEFLIERFGDLNLRIYPDDHLFSKPSGVDLVCKMMKELLDLQESDPKVTILEIGTGTGIIGMHMSKVCKRVHMLDRSDKKRSSLEHAEENVKLNGIPNCFVHYETTVQSIEKVTSTLSEDDKVYAILHNNLDTRRLAVEMDAIASNEKVKKVVYLSFDNKARGVRQIQSLCCPCNDTLVPVKVIPLVIIPSYCDVDLAILLLRESVLEGNTVKNELRQEDNKASKSDRNRESEDDNEQTESGEPPIKKWKSGKLQLNGKKGKQKFKKGKRPKLENWSGGDRWPHSERWQDDDEEWQNTSDAQEMNIRKVGFPNYKPPSLLGGETSPQMQMPNRPHFQQNEKWPRWQAQSWGQPHHMNRGFQQPRQNHGNWFPQHDRYQETNFESEDHGGYQNNWRRNQQYGQSQQLFFNSGEEQPFNDGPHRQPYFNNYQQFNNQRHQQFNSFQNKPPRAFQNKQPRPFQNQQPRAFQNPQSRAFQNQQPRAPRNQPPNASQNQQRNPSMNKHLKASQNQEYGSMNQQYNSENQQYSSENQQYNTSQNQSYNTPYNQQYNSLNYHTFNTAQQQQLTAAQQQQYTAAQQQQYTAAQQQQYTAVQQQQYTAAQQQQYTAAQQQQYTAAQQQQYAAAQQQQYTAAQQQQLTAAQQQQYTAAQQQQLTAAQQQQYTAAQQQQYTAAQQQQYTAAQQQQYTAAQLQQYNSALQMNYDSLTKSSVQQVAYDASGKQTVPQVNYVAPTKSDDPQTNYDATDKSGGSTKRFLTYGLDYNSMQQAQNLGTQNWGAYGYGYADSSASSATQVTNLEQQNAWAQYMPQTKPSAGDTNPN